MHKKDSKNYLIFGHKYYQTSIDSKSYDKKSILKTIHKNFNVSSNRNKFDDSLPVSSNMHHSLYDRENSKYKEPDYSSLIKIYRNTFSTFLESINTKSKINFDFEIGRCLCPKPQQKKPTLANKICRQQTFMSSLRIKEILPKIEQVLRSHDIERSE